MYELCLLGACHLASKIRQLHKLTFSCNLNEVGLSHLPSFNASPKMSANSIGSSVWSVFAALLLPMLTQFGTTAAGT